MLFDAIEQTVGGGVAAPPIAANINRDRFPFEIGKYWLGPMDPTKDWKDGYEGAQDTHTHTERERERERERRLVSSTRPGIRMS